MNKTFIESVKAFAVNEDGVSVHNSVDTKVHAHKVTIVTSGAEEEFLVNDKNETSAMNKAIDTFKEM